MSNQYAGCKMRRIIQLALLALIMQGIQLKASTPTAECDCKKAVLIMGKKSVIVNTDCSEWVVCLPPYNVVCMSFYATMQQIEGNIFAVFFPDNGNPNQCSGIGFSRVRFHLYEEIGGTTRIGYEILPDSQCFRDFASWASAVNYQPPCE